MAAVNLAIAFAQAGRNVVLLDADLREPEFIDTEVVHSNLI
jgi:Mrp family chromosome partitioning ATPase